MAAKGEKREQPSLTFASRGELAGILAVAGEELRGRHFEDLAYERTCAGDTKRPRRAGERAIRAAPICLCVGGERLSTRAAARGAATRARDRNVCSAGWAARMRVGRRALRIDMKRDARGVAGEEGAWREEEKRPPTRLVGAQ